MRTNVVAVDRGESMTLTFLKAVLCFSVSIAFVIIALIVLKCVSKYREQC